MQYKVGDKVSIITEWAPGCKQNFEGRMDRWLGQTMTIRAIDFPYYRMEEDMDEGIGGDGWYWNDKCIAGLVKDPELSEEDLFNILL